MRNRRSRTRGGAVIEFAMLAPLWISMLLGTMWIGTAAVRGLQVQQAARDLASMYSRAVDFSQAPGTNANEMLTAVTAQLGALSGTGPVTVIFSNLTYVGNSVCALAGIGYGIAGNGTPGNTGTHTASSCKNYGQYVFTQRYTQGNVSARSSNFGTPTAGDFDANNSYKVDSPVTYVSDVGDVSSFNLIPAPREDGTDGYQSGQPIYMVEVCYKGASQVGFTSGASYAYAIF